MALNVVEDAEVDEREPLGRTALELLDRLLPEIDVDLRRRRRRHHVTARRDPHTGGVARVQGAVAVEVADVMRGMARRWEAVEPEDALAGDVDICRRHGCELAPERVEGIAVKAARAPLEARG